MQDKATVAHTFWPSPQEYNEAVQNLHLNLKDQQLQCGEIELSALGIPRPITGSFASVYKVTADGQDWALRCFLRAVKDSEWRYKCISEFVQNDSLRSTVACDYQPQGIKVSGDWFPILKMTWVEGETLDNYLAARLSRRQELVTVTNQFLNMCQDLTGAGIAHGDLQHGNIIVRDRGMYLVDYDGMYVPAMEGANSNELGHRNYQHPLRDASHFGPYLDNFSQWVIFISLYATAIDPALYDRLGAGADCLLFRKEDFVNPVRSCAFAALEQHSNEDVQSLARILRSQLQRAPDMVPGLDKLGEIQPADLPSLDPNTATERARPTPVVICSAPSWNAAAATSVAAPISYAFGPQTELELNQPTPRAVSFNDDSGQLNPMFIQALAALPVFGLICMAIYFLLLQYYQGFLLFFLMSVVTEGYIWHGPYYHQQLVARGKVAIGRITRKEFVSTYAESSDDRYRQPSYEKMHEGYFILHYRFSVNDNNSYSRSVQGTMRVDKDMSARLKVGQLVTVLYDPVLPASSVIYKAAQYKAVMRNV